MKTIILIGILVLVFVSGCTKNQEVYNHCMIGCFAGMNYNGSEIIEIDTENIDDEKLKEFVACENHCKVYTNEIKEGRI